MIFSPVNRNRLNYHDNKCFAMDGSSLKCVNSFKYLGHIIFKSLFDDDDIKHEVRNLYMRINVVF